MAKGKDRSQGQAQQGHVQPLRKIAGFHVLPLTLDAATIHYLYCRPHTGKAKQDAPSTSAAALLPPGRTLFVANLPVDATERHLRRLFQKAGRVESVVIRQRAVVGEQLIQEEEGEGEVSESDEGEDEDLQKQESLGIDGTTTAAEQPRRMKKSAKREQQKKPQPPALVPLPLLNPRGQDAFLQTGTSAHVVFLESSGVERALEMVQRPRKWIDPLVEARVKVGGDEDDDQDDGLDANGRRIKRPPPMTASEAQARSQAQQPPPPSGLSYLISSYDAHRPALSAIKAHADSAVARYTFFRSHRSLDPDRTSGTGANVGGIAVASYGPNGEPLDEDGFTIVMPGVAGAKYGRALGESSFGAKGGEFGSSVKVARRRPLGVDEEEERAGKKSERGKGGAEMAGLEDFYRFQTRERKREELAEMRRKFAEDQEKLEAMRGAEKGQGKRRFRPY